MTDKGEAKEWLAKAWDSLWSSDLATIPDFFNEDAELSGFSPPKQTSWKGIDGITAHFKEIQPIIVSKTFNVNRVDLVKDSPAFYATWDATFDLKIPGQEGELQGSGIMYVLREGGKAKVWTAYEDPTPFVAMAAKGQIAAQ